MRGRTVLLLFAACAAGCASSGDDGNGGDGGHPQQGCSTGSDCAAGGVCYDGVCLVPCSGGSCAAGSYCAPLGEDLCAPSTVTVCPATPCNADQICASGLCSTPPPSGYCGTNPFDPDDGCGAHAICLPGLEVDGTVVEDRRCYSLPPCPADGDCPTGTDGALCNDGYFADKDRFCMPGMCVTAAADCPADWHCIMRNSAPPIGYCSDGSAGSLCHAPADCDSGLNCNALGTAIGTCG